MIKTKKQMFIIIGAFALVMLLGTITYAFFNYTRTGVSNTISVGRVNFVSRQTETINLTNLFPIDPTEPGIMDDDTKVGTLEIEIEGDSDYADGVEYAISVVDSNIAVNGKTIPISLDVTVEDLGTSNSNYFSARESKNATIYKQLVGDTLEGDQMLLVGYIKPNTTNGTVEGVDGSITIKAYIDENKILISDTYNNGNTPTDELGTPVELGVGKTVFTTTEWNSLSGVSFKIKVEANEGIWVSEPLSAYRQIADSADSPVTINFANNSSSSNGQGLYLLTGTGNNPYPIYYYRGDIDNNNVVFADRCWQIVRTTETGGIKIIYNGHPAISGSGNNITYDCGSTRPPGHISEMSQTTDLYSTTGYYFADDYEVTGINVAGRVTYRLKSKTNPITQVRIASTSDAQTKIPTIIENYPYTCRETSSDSTCLSLFKVESYESGTYARGYSASPQFFMGTSPYNTNYRYLSYVGYMYGEVYPYASGTVTGAIYGKNVEWDGTNYLVIEDTSGVASTNTTIDNNHHYSCGTAGITACDSVRYYYQGSNYITLTNGEKVEDAIYKMTGNGTAEVKQRNSGYQLNVTSSTVKTFLENWFEKYLTNIIDNNNIDYRPYIEDTVFCNDRSLKTIEGNTNYPTYNVSGWNPNGGDRNKFLYLGTTNRFNNNWYSTTNVPSLTCPNETDQFSVSSSIAHLNYSVGLITADEAILAGAGGNGSSNSEYYLYTGNNYLTMTPARYEYTAYDIIVHSQGQMYIDYVEYGMYIRPVISLKLGTEFVSGGDGTGTNPYVVKYN